MQLEVRKHLFDVLDAIKEIESYAQGLDCSRFQAHGGPGTGKLLRGLYD